VHSSLGLFKAIADPNNVALDIMSGLEIKAKKFPIDGVSALAFHALSSMQGMKPPRPRRCSSTSP